MSRHFTNNMQRRTQQSLILLTILLILIGVFFVAPDAVFAETPSNVTTDTQTGGLWDTIKNMLSTPVLLAVSGILLLLQSGLSILFAFLSYALTSLFEANVMLNPASMEPVQVGWGVLRDIVNASLILIVLWIAFTIIFSIEKYGGARLLAKVIVVALLVNFSLMFVTAVFAFGNALAKPFYNKLPDDIPAFIVEKTQLHNLNSIDEDEAKNVAKKRAEEAAKKTTPQNQTTPPPAPTQQLRNNTISDTLFASLGIHRADAVGGATVGCVTGAIALAWLGPGGLIGCTGGAIVGAIAEWLASDSEDSTGLYGFAYQSSIKMFISVIFLLIMIFAFATIIGLLVVRLVMMIFLSVTAPAALLLYALPGSFGETHARKWISALVSWAFLLPVFYFLFYLAIFLLDKFDSAQKAVGISSSNVSSNPDLFLGVIIAATFMIAAVIFSKKLGGAAGEFVGKWVKQGALLGATGLSGGALLAGRAGMMAAARGTARRLVPKSAEEGGTRMQRAMHKLTTTRGLKHVAAPLTRAVTETVEKEQQEIRQRADELAKKGTKSLEVRRQTALSSKETAALDIALAKKGKMIAGTEQAGLKRAERYGVGEEIIKKNPHLLTRENFSQYTKEKTDFAKALQEFTRTIDKSEVNKELFAKGDDGAYKHNEAAQAFMKDLTSSDYGRIIDKNRELQEAMEEYMQNNIDMLKNSETGWSDAQKTQFRKFMTGGGYRGLGFDAKIPQEILGVQQTPQHTGETHNSSRIQQTPGSRFETERAQIETDEDRAARERLRAERNRGGKV